MKSVTIGFEVHQPFRVRKNSFWEPVLNSEVSLEKYFDVRLNREIMERVTEKCYLPASRIILESIENGENEGYDVKYFFSVSGVFLEQAERWFPELIDIFKQLASTKKIEFLGQTYYHSVTSLWEDLSEWREQVEMQRMTIKDLFDVNPITFENTELITNDRIVNEAEKLGFKSIIIEGKESIVRNPNYVYKVKGRDLLLLLRNYRLSDDIAFRFSSRNWDQYPLTADKYATWVEFSEGNNATIFVDYETFGEHHPQESGIMDFLYHLPRELMKRKIKMRMPSELGGESYSEIVPPREYSSWADIEKNETSWLGNQMQWAYDEVVRRGEYPAKELGGEFLKVWRYFTTSDNYYYLFTGSGGPAEVHNYFSYFQSPIEGFINEFFAINDFTKELVSRVKGQNPFYFYKNGRKFAIVWNCNEVNEVKKRDEKVFKNHEKYLVEWNECAE
ncbi:alpha-amylase [Sulfolobales archaeon HS-7]|nr:alpha-amylase [Sulfolobales archaeon HS-7]